MAADKQIGPFLKTPKPIERCHKRIQCTHSGKDQERHSSHCEGWKAVADGKVGDPTLQGRFEKNPERSLPRRAAQHYLYIKRAWVEFLGEPLTSRRRSRQFGGHIAMNSNNCRSSRR